MSAPEVIIRAESGIGHITLNRPKALQALSSNMCRTMLDVLRDWEVDPAITEIKIDHSGGRGFCAGGDIRELYEELVAGSKNVLEFFRVEYQLNHLLFSYRKPTTCIMDGIVMGGGAGIAMPCRRRIATDATQFAMPETGIGLIPDVGASRFLSRLPGRIGEWLALTGARLNGQECLGLGLATEFKSAGRVEPSPTSIPGDDIDELFSGDQLEEIVAKLKSHSSQFANVQLNLIEKKSPLSGKLALRLMREGRKFDNFADNLKMEYAVVSRLLNRPDIREGIRAYIIDKDNSPHWLPPNLAEVSDDEVEAIFALLPPGEEWAPIERR